MESELLLSDTTDPHPMAKLSQIEILLSDMTEPHVMSMSSRVIQIFVKTLIGKTITLGVMAFDTI